MKERDLKLFRDLPLGALWTGPPEPDWLLVSGRHWLCLATGRLHRTCPWDVMAPETLAGLLLPPGSVSP